VVFGGFFESGFTSTRTKKPVDFIIIIII